MFKHIFFFLYILCSSLSLYAAEPGANKIKTNTTAFNNNLGAGDTTAQAALDTIDNITIGGLVNDTAYAASWNGVTTIAPSKNTIYDKLETLVESVGDCASGDCFTGTAGNTLTFKGTTSGTTALKPTAIAGTTTITLPAENGTIITSVTALGGDVSGTVGAVVITDDSHAHGTSTLSGIDISADTNLTVTAPVVLTDDTLSLTVLKDLVTTSPLTGGTDDIFPGADADITLGLTVAKDIVAGVGLSGGEDNVLPGADADTTLTLDLTEINSATFGSGTFTTLTFNAGITDPVLTFGSNSLALTNTTTFTNAGNAISDAATTFSGDVTGTIGATIVGDDSHSHGDSTVADNITLTNITQITNRSHTSLSDIGTNAHSVIDTFIASKAAASGLASLDISSLVVQNPANATATPTASKIPIADGFAKLDGWITLGASVDISSETNLAGDTEIVLTGDALSIASTITRDTELSTYAPLASPTFTGTVTIPTPFTLGAVSVLPTGTELNFVDGVTSAIQTQIDGKQGTLTNSAGLAAALSDETGTGAAVFANSPVFTTPNIGAATGSITGNAATVTTNANLTGGVTSVGNAATVITNANLTGPITSVGNATSIASQTGTGTKFVVDTSPTFTTSLTTPLIIGGTGTTSTLTYKTTTGVGAAGADHIFQVGNNGATEAMTILNSGNVGIGTTGPIAKLQVAGEIRAQDLSGHGYLSVYGASGSTAAEVNLGRAGSRIWHFGMNASNDFNFVESGVAERLTVKPGGNIGIGTTTPTAVLHLKAGTATANTAPLKFNSGTLNTTAEAGAVEFLTDAFYGTITTGAARKTFAFLESPAFTTPALGTPASGVMTNVTGLTEAGQTLADNATNNASISAHGYLKKLDNTATNFMNGAGNWATPVGSGMQYTDTRYKVGSFTRDLSTASGTQAITGVGFAVKSVEFFMTKGDAVNGQSWGFSQGTADEMIEADAGGVFSQGSAQSIYYGSSGVAYSGKISTYDSDGFTIAWTRTNAPTGTITIHYLAFR